MYQIFVKDHPDAKVTVHIDGRNPTAVPAIVLAGIGNKEKRYEKWLDECLTDGKKQQVLNFMIYLNKMGKEKGDLFLKCQCKFHKFHARLVKEFLVKNKETLDTLLQLMEKPENSDGAPMASSRRSGTPEEMIARGLLTQEDMDFFTRSINEQQELGAEKNVEENH
jgi:hypothetical protein